MSDNDSTLAQFDQAGAERLEKIYLTPDVVHQREQIFQWLDVKPGMQALDIGCGPGDIVPLLPLTEYTGIDLSPTMVTESDRFDADLVAAGRVAFRLGSAEQLPFPDASFDRIFSIGVIHFWPDPTRPLAETRRVLKAGGVALAACLAPRAGGGTRTRAPHRSCGAAIP